MSVSEEEERNSPMIRKIRQEYDEKVIRRQVALIALARGQKARNSLQKITDRSVEQERALTAHELGGGGRAARGAP